MSDTNKSQASVRPYGTAIHESIAGGDLAHMKSTAAAAQKHLDEHGDIAAALEALKIEIAKLEAKK